MMLSCHTISTFMSGYIKLERVSHRWLELTGAPLSKGVKTGFAKEYREAGYWSAGV